jgi:serine protease Do
MKRSHSLNSHRWLALALCVVLLCPCTALAQDGSFRADYLKTSPQFKKIFRQVIAPARKSTVTIVERGQTVALGTVVSEDGLILTKASEMGKEPVVRLADGRELKGLLVGDRKEHDLALLKIEATGLTPVQWRPSHDAPVGHWAVSVGTAEDPIALGVISVGLRKINLNKAFPKLPALNGGYLGVTLSPAEAGARIESVLPDTGASKAGLKAADLILTIAGKATKDAEGVRKVLGTYKAGDDVVVRVRRGDQEFDLKARLGTRPLSRGEIQNRMGSKLSKRTDGFPVILQHDSVVLPEQCGGPLVDLEGKTIGINICRAGRTESFAIPSEVVMPLVNELRNGLHQVSKK